MHHLLDQCLSSELKLGLKSRGALVLLMSLGLLNATPSWGAVPGEKPVDQVQRTASSGAQLRTTLSRNIMKQVPYEDSYTVEVPYEDTETYYEDVPYEEQEAYTDYETYVESEYRCHTENETHQECHTENQCYEVPGGQECHTENECHTQGGGQQCSPQTICKNVGGHQECHTENQCHEVPGHQECRPVQKCEQRPGHQECRQQQICRDVSYPHQVCGYENVTKTREVTKYRTVTKYRHEQRTRTVTRYRTETRCCVTKYRDEFNHQASLDVLVQFPPQAILQVNEQEVFKLTLQGDEAQMSVKMDQIQTIYGYKIVDQRLNGRTFVIILGLVAKYTEADLGVQTISTLSLSFDGGVVTALIDDQGQKARVTSQYNIQVLKNGTPVAEGRGVTQGGLAEGTQVRIPVMSQNSPLDESQNYELKLVVQRAGLVLAGPMTFEKQGLYDATPLENAGLYSDPALLTNWDILGVGEQSGLYFKDKTPYNAIVKTTYKVTLQLIDSNRSQAIGTAVMDRRDVKVNAEGLSQILLVRDMRISADTANRMVTSRATIHVDIEITRQSARLNHGQPIVIKKTFTDRNRD